MTCIKTGARVKLVNYGCVVAADLYAVGTAIVIRANPGIQHTSNFDPDAWHDYQVLVGEAAYMNSDIGVIVVEQGAIAKVELTTDLERAKMAMLEYDIEIRAGGEPHYPQWAADLINGKAVVESPFAPDILYAYPKTPFSEKLKS